MPTATTPKLTPVIGLEIHVQLKTNSKMFCADDNNGENKPANTTVSEISMGHPGTLPVPNRKAIEWTIKTGLALNCEIPATFEFERKNYFYPDLPKGYQITSSSKPPCVGGYLVIPTQKESRKIRLHHIHLEEDAAKNFHSTDGKHTLVDYNRAGTPLMEIVTEADIRTAQEAKKFLQELRLITRYLGVSDADMEKGHLRCDANVSLTDQTGEDGVPKKLYPKTEVKNLNSFKSVERAIEYEIMRQTKLWNEGEKPHQATRGWNDDKGISEEQRTKEDAHDYRYFPEPDIPPINLTKSKEGIDVSAIQLPELPAARRKRFADEYDMTADNARVLVDDRGLADFFEKTISELRAWLQALGEEEGTEEEIWERSRGKLAKLTVNWLVNKLLGITKSSTVAFYDNLKITPENFAEFITMLHTRKFNNTIALQVLTKMFETGKDPSVIVEEENLSGGQEMDINALIEQIIKDNPKQVEQYKAGKETLLQFFVGQVMRVTKGQADPEETAEKLKDRLG